ncbi:MAG: class I SAM-dependent methyltransferase, partial [Candidatus Thermoplasmatota archaeon]|nr:class I SAM-dependent methyltransferase [Candidatus Thermoplasmatota archaeon]
TVLDLGAGTGFLTFSLAEELTEGEVYAVDIREEMIKKLEEKCSEKGYENVEILHSREDDIPIPEKKVDKTFMLNVLHEVKRTKTLEEVWEVMKEDGEIFVLDWDKGVTTRFGPPSHERLTRSEAIDELEEKGFEIIDSGSMQDHFWIIAKR